MNRAEVKKAIEDSQGPASEAARFLDQLNEPLQCIHFKNGECNLIDICINGEVKDVPRASG